MDHKARSVYDSTVVGDYCFAGTNLIGYDDHESVVKKVRYAKKERFACRAGPRLKPMLYGLSAADVYKAI